MDIREEAKRLDEVLASINEAWQKELEDILEEIKQCDTILADKESKTDRSENATFQIAKDTRDLKMSAYRTIYTKIQTYMEYKDTYVPTGIAAIGSTIELRPTSVNGSTDVDKRAHRVVKIVNPGLSDAPSNLIDSKTPLGNALLGHRVGDSITIKTRKGLITYVIERMY